MDNTLAQRIAEVRKKERLSQAEFGNRIGVSGPSISKYESGAIPDANTLLKLHSEFNLSYKWLLEGKGSMYERDNIGGETNVDAEIFQMLKTSNNHLNMLIGLLADKVKSLGGDLPPGLGKLWVPNITGSPLTIVKGTVLGTELRTVA